MKDTFGVFALSTNGCLSLLPPSESKAVST
jgi:hypothetical protein